jgi:hypothetical protein
MSVQTWVYKFIFIIFLKNGTSCAKR